MGDEQVLRYRIAHGDGLVVRRLLDRDGFRVQGPEGPDGDIGERRSALSVVAETDGRASRVREVIARWAPEATSYE